MKKFFTIILLLFIFSSFCQAQESRKNVITTNLLNLLFDTHNIQYERRFNTRALRLSAARTRSYYFINTYMDGWYATLDYKVYLNAKQIGFKNYIAPYLRYQNMYFEGANDAIRVKTVGGGLLYGHVFRLFRLDWLALDLHGGVNYIPEGYKLIKGNSPPNIDLPLTSYRVGGRFGLSLGASFWLI